MFDFFGRIIGMNAQGTKGDTQAMKDDDLMIGIIASRKCPMCGHHEVGYETAGGVFVPLRPGDRIGVFTKSPAHAAAGDKSQLSEIAVDAREKDPAQWAPWIPEPIRSNPDLCRKYGVLIQKEFIKGDMSPALYETVYRQKLQWLIEKEVVTPLSVILDRFFVAPHLASGNAKQVADALWEELDEIRAPVTWMTAWLRNKDDVSLLKMIHPKTRDDLEGEMVSDDQLREELNRMSLEAFLETL